MCALGVRDAYLTGLKSRSCQHSQCASRRVSRSASASHCSAHSIGFVTLWMLANPFFGFVGYVPVLNTFSIRFRTGVTPRLATRCSICIGTRISSATKG